MQWTNILSFGITLSPLDYLILSTNALLIIFARPVLKRFAPASANDKALAFRVRLLRGLNFLILIVFAYEHIYRPADESTNHALSALSILVIIYLSNLGNFLLQFFIHKQYGKARHIGDKILYVETYQSRLFSILAAITITLVALISIVRQLGFESLLEAGGVLGFFGVFLALTQASWAPDIISGLIILNSDMFEEGDIIEFDHVIARIYRTKLFHTEIINLRNNHRIMLRNAAIRDRTIHNLSKFATGKGLRECLHFNIGYASTADSVKLFFRAAYDRAINEGTGVEGNADLEVKVLDTGDHAITWGFIFHTKKVEHIIKIRRDLRELILEESIAANISLATPITQTVSLNKESH
ncbi:MAG: small-conductance mechanosensitive channel [Flavobacteriales bacterium]|jgi:small-conductance mechanosensitive channel